MARPVRFTEDSILDGAARAVEKHGGKVTIAQIAAEVGAPTGSIYHRFPSRDHLLIRLWLRAIRRFHMGLLAAPDIAATSRHIPQFCRNNPIDAQVMTLFRHADLIATAPVELRNEVFHVNDSAWAKCRDLTKEFYSTTSPELVERMNLAIYWCPYSLVRRYIGQPIPPWLDDATVAATLAIAEAGRTPPE